MSSSSPAGWYPDPSAGGSGDLRWWDGAAWTAQVHSVALPVSTLPPPQVPAPAVASKKRRLPIWAWILIGIAVLALGLILAPVFAPLWLVVLITAIVALVKNTPTWLRLRNRKVATIVTAVSAVAFLITANLSTVVLGSTSNEPVAEPAPIVTTEPSTAPTPSPTPSSSFPDDDAEPVAFTGETNTAADTSATDGRTALDVLETVLVKGRAAKTGYDRDEFGQRWLDVDRNGCDTRNDTLAAQLSDVVFSGRCKVTAGILDDPFTGKTIAFERGQGTSELVQIDHVVALSDAWQKGAQQLTADQRATFANDPLNLLAVDGRANAQKGDGDAATWLPSNKSFRCEYVARQVSVKATYGLWVTQAEHDAIARVLGDCVDELATTSTFAVIAPVEVARGGNHVRGVGCRR
ncbi:MAG TPA: hypothetical protein DIW46_08270 [Microbacterium sp.]|nr:hypothetical protein [Microbacterium sp.]